MSDFNTKFDSWLKGVTEIVQDHNNQQCPNLDNPTLEVIHGRKYVKVAISRPQTSVFAFINTENGDVLMPASWKAPAKHARGNIFNEDNGLNCVGPYGIAYLR